MKLKKVSYKKAKTPSYPHYNEYVKEGRQSLKKIAVAVATIAATGTLAGAVLTGCGDDEIHRTAGVKAISRPAVPTNVTTGTSCSEIDNTTSSWVGQFPSTPPRVKLGGKPVAPLQPKIEGKIVQPVSPQVPKIVGDIVQPVEPVVEALPVKPPFHKLRGRVAMPRPSSDSDK